MKRVLKLVVLGLALYCVAGVALANIPDYVDFWAEQTVAGGSWAIHQETGFPTDHYNRYGYDPPVWDGNILKIDNQYVPDNTKQLWVEISFTAAGKFLPDPFVTAVDNGVPPEPITDITSVDTGTNLLIDVTWSWRIFPQPAVEWVDFSTWGITSGSVPGFTFSIEESGVTYDFVIDKIEVGTYCVPTPSALVLCVIGVAFAAVGKRFRRRK